MKHFELTAALALLIFVVPAFADDDWNQFRGPRGDGLSLEKNLPIEWEEGSDAIQWKTPIHGKGWSSPVVKDGQVWMATAPEDGHAMYAVCVELDSGKIIHDIKLFDVEDPQFCHPTNSYASCTPFLEEGRAYLHFGQYGTACVNSKTGEVIWKQEGLKCDDFRGPASSPVVHGDLVFLNFDGVDVQFVVALDKNTGKVVWNTDRNIDYGTDVGDRKKAYGTPSIIEFKGRQELISPSAAETIAYAPLTGEILWRVKHGGMNAAAKPLFGHDLLYISAGSGNSSMIAVRPGGSGDVTDSHVVWSVGKSVPKRSSQLLIKNRIYMTDDSGVISCLKASDGGVVWQKRLRGDFWSSPIAADNHIYFSNKAGQTYVITTGDAFEQVAVNELDAGINASPAVAGDSLLIRTFTHLYRISR